MITDFNIFSFIQTYGIEPLKTTANITAITSLGSGIYKVTTSATTDLINGYTVTLSGLDVFNGRFEISNVTTTYFYITRKFNESTYQFESIGTLTLPTTYTSAKWTNEIPLFEYDRLDRLNAKINQYSFDVQKYPLIALVEQPLKRIYKREFGTAEYDLIISNALFIFVLPFSENWTRQDYETYSFAPMRQMALNFIDYLELTEQNTTGTYVQKIENFEINDYFQFTTTNGKATFDSGLCGVSLNIGQLVIKNAGYICQS